MLKKIKNNKLLIYISIPILTIITIITLISSNWMFSSNTESNTMLLKTIPIIVGVINIGTTLLTVIRTKTKRN